MRVRRSRLLFISESEMGFYFGPEATKGVFKKLSFVHFTANQATSGDNYSLRDIKIFPKFRESEPKLIKITMREMRSRLLFPSLSEVELYFGAEAQK